MEATAGAAVRGEVKLEVRGVAKRYGDVIALAETTLQVREGEFLTLLGPSGSGKTTLLTLVAGLSRPDSGTIHIGGRDATNTPPYERDIGLVFQNYALFPHMTVAENVAFPLKMRGVRGPEQAARVKEALEAVRLPDVGHRLPRALSGGQQQRIALARCMVYRPSIILMDEPLGALDKRLRDEMQIEIRRLHRSLGTTIVYVTHDQEEAMTLSDRICLMNGGRVEQLGKPDELYFRPGSVFAAGFIGDSNMLAGTVVTCGGGRASLAVAAASSPLPAQAATELAPGSHAVLVVRPERVRLVEGADAPACCVDAIVADVVLTGAVTRVYAELGDGTLLRATLLSDRGGARTRPGDRVRLGWSAEDGVALPRVAGAGRSP
jgi:putative spermidine/putrescine transport system ATP-binding protein